MAYIRITKVFHFEMAHALHGYDGKCAQMHGHSYELSVTVLGEPKMNYSDPKLGMVMDFGDLKKIVSEKILSKWDHALMLSSKGGEIDSKTKALLERVIYVDFQPTSENMVSYIAEKLIEALPEGVRLHSLKLMETSSSYAEWFASDNPDQRSER